MTKHLVWGAILIVGAVGPTVCAEAKSPPGRFVISPTGNTVFDNATGLTWLRQEQAALALTYAAKLICDVANADGGGWQVPSFRQLMSIMDRSFPGPIYDTAVFLPPPGSNAVSGSSTKYYEPSMGMVFRTINVQTGAYLAAKPSYSATIRCVRK